MFKSKVSKLGDTTVLRKKNQFNNLEYRCEENEEFLIRQHKIKLARLAN
jgi:hypothetical protein